MGTLEVMQARVDQLERRIDSLFTVIEYALSIGGVSTGYQAAAAVQARRRGLHAVRDDDR